MPGSTSAGQQALAIACGTTLEALGWTTRTLGATWFLGPGDRAAARATARTLLAVPGLYDAFHFTALRTGSRLAMQADLAMRLRLVPRLRDYLDRDPVELVISISATGASAVSAIASRYPSLGHIVFCADASPHRRWSHPQVDRYLGSSAAAGPGLF